MNLGARFVLSDHLSAGLVYRQGRKFDYRASSTVLLTDPPTVVADLRQGALQGAGRIRRAA